MKMSPASNHVWKFFRCGGLDQVALESGADLLHLEELDQKLWVALSCPVKGLEIDEATLALVDADGDGRIRVPELLGAVKWAVARVTDAGDLLRGQDGLALASLAGNDEGNALRESARAGLQQLGLANATAVTVEQVGEIAKKAAAAGVGGEGSIAPGAVSDPALQALIADIVACVGGVKGRSGAVGVTAEEIEKFYVDLALFAGWKKQGGAADLTRLGEFEVMKQAVSAVRAKIDDYFGRCRLAAFDPRAQVALNRDEAEYTALVAGELSMSAGAVAGFPLARVSAHRPLPLREGVNPAWADAIANFLTVVVTPLFGAAKAVLTEAEWLEIKSRLAAHEKWLGGKAGGAVEKLGLARVEALLADDRRAALAELLARDKASEGAAKAIADLVRLVRYHRDLRALLHNFVNFADFYARDRAATFQAGTLYLDSRSTTLCVRVDAASPLAAMSKAYIAYCTCTRKGEAPLVIAACFTQGDSDYLFVGRHGVFYDRKGRDWDAVITSIVDSPISIRQAFWAPYKKLLRLIEEQVAKRAAAAEAESNARLAAAAEKTAQVDKAPPAPPKKVDVGTVAAIGVAIAGAMSALTLILGYVFQLKFWQYPLVLLGLVLVVSGPSMLIAWLKLRQRTLGPILEANGWAVNGRVRINTVFGSALTALAVKPPGAQISLEDPYADKEAARRRRRTLALVVLLVLAGAAAWVRYDRLQRGHYFWQPAPAPVAAPAAAPAAPAATVPPAP